MKVIVGDNVVEAIDQFYIAAMLHHITLSAEVVTAKKERLLDALYSLAGYHAIYLKARLRQAWVAQEWQEFICEDFHFAYEVALDSAGEEVIVIRDAVHSLMCR